jgi:hypothetical protein
MLSERIGDVFEEYQPKHNMLVLGRVHIGTQLISRRPQRFLDFVVHLSVEEDRLDIITGREVDHSRIDTEKNQIDAIKLLKGPEGSSTKLVFNQVLSN